MFKILKNAWSVPELRKKILIVLGLLLVFRFGSYIPVPGINRVALESMINSDQSGLLGVFNIISGGAFSNLSIFAMSITPYINASIIIQLLTVAIPALEKMAKEGMDGRKKLAQYTRYLTIVLALIQSIGIAISFKSVLYDTNFLTYFMIVLSLTAGTAFIMWLGEQMTEYGIGNGTSLIIFAGIISGLVGGIQSLLASTGFYESLWGKFGFVAIILVLLLLIVAVVWVQKAERRIPVQYAKRVVGRKMYGGQSTHIPIALSMSGVMPIILAMSILMFPAMIINLVTKANPQGIWYVIYHLCNNSANSGIGYTVGYCIIYSLLIIGFTFFYTIIVFNPVEVANNLKKNGGFIPGIRAGKPTADYLANVLNKITIFGAVFIALVAIFPVIVQTITGITIGFGGTALLIVVGVALETVKQLEAQLVMKHYKGFLD
ncbi:MAG: preprotein translocase subunit SecY [Clostridia bacterium]|nr:preprotein translocase subunit SecY [Clostridia bacterium]